MEEFPENTWAQLVSTADVVSDPVPIPTDKFTIGRSKGTDLCLNGNKLVSGKHCFIERDAEGKAWLCDTSTNGTLLNLTKKLIHTRHQLDHGDEIHVVYRKTEPELNVSYLFQDLVCLKQEEEEATQEYSSDMDTTLENKELDEIELETVRDKRKSEESDEEAEDAQPSKRQKTDESCSQHDVEADKVAVPKEESQPTKEPSKEADPAKTESKPEETKDQDSEKAKSKSKGGKKAKKGKVDGASNIADAASKEEAVAEAGQGDGEKEGKEESKKTSAQSEQDAALEETLTCIICQEIMYNCVSLQPCLHSFCAGCYSEWMERSTECPSCRVEVERVKKSHMLNNLVEMYLSQHPEKKRSEEELKKQDEKNQIKQDLVKPSSPTRDLSQEIDDNEDYEGYESPTEELGRAEDEAEDGEGYTDSDEDDGGIKPPVYGGPPVSLFGTATHTGTYMLPTTICRQCPQATSTLGQAARAVGGVASKLVGFVTGKAGTSDKPTTTPTTTTSSTEPGTSDTAATAATAAADGASTSSSATATGKTMATPPKHTCKPGQIHMLCQCCLQAMPDRRADRVTDPTLPPQQCSICYRMFCHAYWGCRKADCRGCLGKLSDMNFGDNSLHTLILENQYESTIFQNYLKTKGVSVGGLLTQCCQKLDEGKYSYTTFVHGGAQSSDRIMCYPCALRCFRDLAYQYRKAIPNEDLPAEVALRQDCYWGRQCRSQKNRPHHAANFNHICEQTRR